MNNTTNFWLIILFSGLFYWLAHSLTRPLIALYALSLGMNEVEIGIIVGVYAVLPFLLAIPSGGIADTIGRVKVLRIGCILMLVSGIFYMLSANVYFLFVGQVFAGLGQMLVWLVIQVLITADKNKQSERIATFTLFNTLGQIIGPLLGGFLTEKYHMGISFGVYTVFSFLLILLSFQLKEQTKTVRVIKVNIREMYRNSFRLLKNKGIMATLLCTFIALFILDARMTFLPLYLQDIGISPFEIGLLISIGACSALLIKPIYPALIKYLGYKVLLIITFLISLSLLFLTPFLTQFYSFAALLLFSGLALGINQPLSLSMISDQTEESERGIAIGLRLMANRMSQLMDPFMFGILTIIVGLKISFIIVGAFLLLLSIVTVLLLQIEEKKQQVAHLNEESLKF